MAYFNSCYLPHEVLQKESKFTLGIYGYILDGEDLKKRLSLNPIECHVIKGSYEEGAIDTDVPTPNVFEIYFNKIDSYEQQINDLFENANEALKKIKHFNSIADMKADTTLLNTYLVKTLGYYEANDGGGAEYLIREMTETDVEDNGSIHFLSNGFVAELIVDDSVNVKQFGAKGDNKNDDTVAMQNAINKYASKKTIYVPNGTYLISHLKLKKQVKFIGEAKTETILKSVANNTNTSLIYGEDLEFQHSVIAKLTIDGNKNNNTNIIDGIHLEMINETSYEVMSNYQELNIQNCSGSGLVMNGKQGTNLFIQVRLKDIFSHNNNQYGYCLNYISDSYIDTCECCLNKQGGFYGVLYSTKITSCKTWFNGIDNNGSGFEFLNSTRLSMLGCEGQDNFGHGIKISNSTFIDLISCDVDNNGVLTDENLTRIVRKGECVYSGVYFDNVTRANINISADNFMYSTYGYMQKTAVEIIGGGVISGVIKTRNQQKTPVFTDVDLTNCEFIIDGVIFDKSISTDITTLTMTDNYLINTTNSMNRLTKKNNRIHLQCIIENQSDISSEMTTIFTLPEEYRPKNAISYSCFLGSSAYNFNSVGNLLISVNGNVAIRNISDTNYKFASICIDYDN